MQRIIETLSTLPTVAFTGLLVFCLAWWFVSLVVSGADGDADFDADCDGDFDADCDGADGQGRGDIARFLAVGSVPLSLAVTILSFGAWATSLLLSLFVDDLALAGAAVVVAGIGVALASVVVGSVGLRIFARPAARIFQTHGAPQRSVAVGSAARIRTVRAGAIRGDAEVLNGPTRGSIVGVNSVIGALAVGQVVHLIDYDAASEMFTVSELDEDLAPPPSLG